MPRGPATGKLPVTSKSKGLASGRVLAEVRRRNGDPVAEEVLVSLLLLRLALVPDDDLDDRLRLQRGKIGRRGLHLGVGNVRRAKSEAWRPLIPK